MFKNRDDKNEFCSDPMVSYSHLIIELSRLTNVEKHVQKKDFRELIIADLSLRIVSTM
jgi:hypothetical protein